MIESIKHRIFNSTEHHQIVTKKSKLREPILYNVQWGFFASMFSVRWFSVQFSTPVSLFVVLCAVVNMNAFLNK